MINEVFQIDGSRKDLRESFLLFATPRSALLLFTHSLDPCLWGKSDHPAFGTLASLSLHLASSSITPAGSVHKSRGDNVVRM